MNKNTSPAHGSARKSPPSFLKAIAAAAVVASMALPAHALTFTRTFDVNYNATAISTIDSVLAGYSAQFSDNFNVNLVFIYTGNGLGTSTTTAFTAIEYQTYYNALKADGKTADDATALLSIAPGGANNPVNGATTISQGRPGLAAVGIDVGVDSNFVDGTIDLNLGIMNYTRSSIDPAKYDLQAVTQHEVNEVLGIISNVGNSNPRPIDLFRYDDAGMRTFTTAGDNAYFSIDGGNTRLARFNQIAGNDYGDFYSCPSGAATPSVQDACSTPGATPNQNVELRMLDVVGYDRVAAVPEPETWALMLAGLGMVGSTVARRRRQ